MAKDFKGFDKGIKVNPIDSGANPITDDSSLADASNNGALYYFEHKIKAIVNAVRKILVDTDSSQTLTNKTVVVSDNTVTTAASGNLAATELNAALSELQSDIDTRATSSDLSTHTSGTEVHGATGAVVGTTNSQILTNKTIDADSNTISNIANSQVKAAAGIVESKLALDYSTSSLNTSIGNHTSATEAHGATGAVVGTTNTQTLTNKSIDADSNTLTNIANTQIKAAAGIVESKLTLDYSTSGLNTAITNHTGASSGVHGVTGSVVGTTDTQTLTNKTFDSDTVFNKAIQTKAGSDNTSTGSLTAVSTANMSYLRFTGAAPSVHGFANGADGKFLVVTNSGTGTLTLNNDSATETTATNRIITGNGKPVIIAAGGSIGLIYDSANGFWRVKGGVGGGTTTYATIAEAKAETNGKDNDLCYVVENESFYRYEETSMSGVLSNDTDVISVTSDANARWMAIAGQYQYNRPVTTLEKRTIITSATSSSWSTGASGKPQINLRFWDNSVSKFLYFEPSSYIDSDSTGSIIYYDFTGVTFNSNDYMEIITVYPDANVTNATEYDSGWILVSAINNLKKGSSVSGWHEVNLPSGFLDYPAGYNVTIDDGTDIYPANITSTVVLSKSSTVIRIAFDTTGLSSTDKFRIVASKNPRAVGYSPLKKYDITVTSNQSGWTTNVANAIPYQLQDGTWRLKVFCIGTHSSTYTSAIFSITGILIKNISGYYPQLRGSMGSDAYGNKTFGTFNTNQISFSTGTASNQFAFTGEFDLESKPTWAD